MLSKKDLQGLAKEFGLDFQLVEDIYLQQVKEEPNRQNFEAIVDELMYDDGQGESCDTLYSGGIYSLDTDGDIEVKVKKNTIYLNEGSADVDNWEKLEKQALDYFKRPTRHPLNEEDQQHSLIVGHVGLYSHTSYDQDGLPYDQYTSCGIEIYLPISKVADFNAIDKALAERGIAFNKLVQIKFYGAGLYDLVGAYAYKKDEQTRFCHLSDDYENVLYAVPDSSMVPDDSIYTSLNRLVQDEVLFGRSASEVLGEAFTHWSLCQDFYEKRIPEIEEERRGELSQRKIVSLMTKRKRFKAGFSFEVESIEKLNQGELSINELMNMSSHEVNRILWVCKSKDFSCRIESKAVFLQLQALSRRLKTCESHTSFDSFSEEAIKLIDLINSGGDVDSIELSDELLKEVFRVLWDRSNSVQISSKYREVYFELKKRFKTLTNDKDCFNNAA